MVHVSLVQRLVAVERPVLLHQVDDGDVAGTVGRPELAVCVLEHGDYHVELVDEHADVVLLDPAAKTDGDAGEPVLFVFLHQVLDFGHVALAVRALGAEVVDEQRPLAEVAEQDARVANSRERHGKVHLHGLVGGGILHELDVGHLRFGCELGKRKCRGDGQKCQKTFCDAHYKLLMSLDPCFRLPRHVKYQKMRGKVS